MSGFRGQVWRWHDGSYQRSLGQSSYTQSHSHAAGICNLAMPWEKRRKRGVREPRHSLLQCDLFQEGQVGWNTLDGLVAVKES